MDRDPGKSSSVDKALDVLEAFTPQCPEWGLSSLSRELGLGKPTLHRLLRTLADRGYLTQDPDSRVYRLGYRLLEVGQAALVDAPTQVAQPHLDDLAQRSGEQATLWVPDGAHAVCVMKVEGLATVRTHIRLGSREPAWRLASGRCLLANQRDRDPSDLRGLGDGEVDAARLERNLADVREQGYAVSRGDRWPDVAAVSAPVFDHSGVAVAAVAISAPTARFDDAACRATIEAVVQAAGDISRALGATVRS